MECAATGCRETSDERLCDRHAARLRAGWGLPTVLDPLPGAPSGQGRYGILDLDETGVLCHECGVRFIRLAIHLRR